jgi:hypothetical protein
MSVKILRYICEIKKIVPQNDWLGFRSCSWATWPSSADEIWRVFSNRSKM